MTFELGFHERAALRALLDRPHSREELDRAAHASNSPALVMRLRRAGVAVHTALLGNDNESEGNPQ